MELLAAHHPALHRSRDVRRDPPDGGRTQPAARRNCGASSREGPKMTNAMTAKSLTEGAHHIGLAVRDVAEARDFFVNALGFAVAADRPDYPAIFVSDGTTLDRKRPRLNSSH